MNRTKQASIPQMQPNPQPGQADLRQFMITISPYGFIKAALAANDATFEQRTFNRLSEGVKTNVIGFTAGKYWITGEFDKDNLLERVVTRFPDPVLGDMAIEVRYTDWKDAGGGAKFRSTFTPTRATTLCGRAAATGLTYGSPTPR